MNRMRNNNLFGIDLLGQGQTGLPVVDVNDPNDTDVGPNNRQNAPELSAAEVVIGKGLTIEGTLDSTPGASFVVDFYHTAACNVRGRGEGGVHLGSTNVTLNANGANASFSVVVLAPAQAGGVVTATATASATGDTSEFSNCAAVTVG
jgi:titin